MLARPKNNPLADTTEENVDNKNLCYKLYAALCYLWNLAKDFFSMSPQPTRSGEKTIVKVTSEKITVNNPPKTPTNTSIVPNKKVQTDPVKTKSAPAAQVSQSGNHYGLFGRNDPYGFYEKRYGIPAPMKRNYKIRTNRIN